MESAFALLRQEGDRLDGGRRDVEERPGETVVALADDAVCHRLERARIALLSAGNRTQGGTVISSSEVIDVSQEQSAIFNFLNIIWTRAYFLLFPIAIVASICASNKANLFTCYTLVD